LELFAAKSGAEIAGQLYAFADKGGRDVALRPEMTPSLARVVGARAGALPKPIKWYCVPQFFRYERPQRGRLREFYQWNVDVVGSTEPAADAEGIAVAVDGLRELGLRSADIVVRLNDRRFVHTMLSSIDVAEDDEPEVLALIDKLARDRNAADRLRERLGEVRAKELLGWCEEPPLERAEGLREVMAACGDFGIAEFLEPDFRIVRGLAYYTGPVWEIFDRGGELRSVAGGGRYDNLFAQLGGPDLPATGFGMGDAVLTELLSARGLLPAEPPRVDVFVIPIGAEMGAPARQVVRRLRDRNVAAETPYTPLRVGKALRAADQAGARRAVFVGPDEWADGAVKIRDLVSGEERVVPVDELE
jgi:histidyl-tRNA synthetase